MQVTILPPNIYMTKFTKYLIYYRHIDMGMGGCEPEFLFSSGSVEEAQKRARIHCEEKKNTLSGYLFRIEENLFPPDEEDPKPKLDRPNPGYAGFRRAFKLW